MATKPEHKLEISEAGTYLVVKEADFRKSAAKAESMPTPSPALELLSCLGDHVFTLAFLVKYFREQKGWTLRKLDEESGVPYSQISNFENGKATPEQVSIDNLSRALGEDFRRALKLISQINS